MNDQTRVYFKLLQSLVAFVSIVEFRIPTLVWRPFPPACKSTEGKINIFYPWHLTGHMVNYFSWTNETIVPSYDALNTNWYF